MVTLRFKNPTFCLQNELRILQVLEQKATISLYSIKWFIYIRQGVCLLCGTNWILKYSSGYFFLSARTMDLAVIRWALTEESRVRSQICPCSNCGEQSDPDTCLCPSTSPFPVNIIPWVVQTHLYTHVVFTKRTNGRSLGTSSSALP